MTLIYTQKRPLVRLVRNTGQKLFLTGQKSLVRNIPPFRGGYTISDQRIPPTPLKKLVS